MSVARLVRRLVRKRAELHFASVLENTRDNAADRPEMTVFERQKFDDFGRDGLVRKAGRMALSMFSTPRPPVALEKAASGFQSHNGARTMTNTTATQAVNRPRLKLYKGVSCVTFSRGADGLEFNSVNYFDVPDEDYVEGHLTGVKIAYEVMAAARKGDFDSFTSVHQAAFKVGRDSTGNAATARDGAGAASGYLQTMSDILELAAQKLDLSNLMQDSFLSHEAVLQDAVDDMKADNLASMEIMRAASA